MKSTALFRLLATLVIALAPLMATAQYKPAPYTPAPVPQVSHRSYFYDTTSRTALSLGVQSQVLSTAQVYQLFPLINGSKPTDVKPIPADLTAQWNQLVYTGQVLESIRALPRFFPVGIEVEMAHDTKKAWKDFTAGAENIFGIVAGHFGETSRTISDDGGKSAAGGGGGGKTGVSATMNDAQNREWSVKLEWAREAEGSNTPSGWEMNSPIIKNPDELEPFSALMWRMGKSPFGQIAHFNGIHQNFDLIPAGEPADPKLMALTAANFTLLHEQFFPAIMKILDVQRYYAHDNPFIRPYLFDHEAYMMELALTPPSKMTLQRIEQLQMKYLREEATAQLAGHIDDPQARAEADKNWQTYRQNWKARDFRIKFFKKADGTVVAIVESRIADHKPSEPWVVARGTLLMQMLLNKSYELAKQGQIYKPRIRWREKTEDIHQYYKTIQSVPSMSVDELIKVLGADAAVAGIFKNEPFATKTGFSVAERTSYGFEVELFSPYVVQALTPNDPALRAIWSNMKTAEQRIQFMRKMGFEFDGKFTETKYAIFTALFRLDLDAYPFMAIRPQLEESGRMEVMSNGRLIYDIPALENKATVIYNAIRDPREATPDINIAPVSFHFHQFSPKSELKAFTPEDNFRFTRLLERLSTFMNIADYTEVKPDRPPHRLDSWSLDRYSKHELERVFGYMNGTIKMSNSEQKYHNMGMRPVDGGIDAENRSVGADIPYGGAVLQVLRNAVVNKDFGPEGSWSGPWLFMEPRHYASRAEYDEFTLATAMKNAGYKLTSTDVQILEKLQFEIYKPSMSAYMRLPNDDTVQTIPPEEMDTRYLRTNFESNVAYPLQKWEAQPYVSYQDRATIQSERARFLLRLSAILERIKTNPDYKFIIESPNFLPLCEYLRRSTHPSRPQFLTDRNEGDRRRRILEDLVYELRGNVVRFAQATQLQNVLARSLSRSGVPQVLLYNFKPTKPSKILCLKAM